MSIDWEKIKHQGFSEKLIKEVRDILMKGEVAEIRVDWISDQTGEDPAEVRRLLDLLAEMGAVMKRIRYRCPGCENIVSQEEAGEGVCPGCVDDNDEHVELIREDYYVPVGPASQDIRWVIFIHGMNTLGIWQEKLAWHLGTLFSHSVPVYIYKYGMVRLSSVLRRRQRKLVQRLYEQIKQARKAASIKGFGGKPAVIAHSFGTWQIGHLMRELDTLEEEYEKKNPDEDNRKLEFGRVILTGCILRPDFEWDDYIKSGRVEAVFNHIGTKDIPVLFTQFFIPDSGPSGREGFRSESVFNLEEKGLSHEAFFFEENMDNFFADNGKWKNFLTIPLGNLGQRFPNRKRLPSWKAKPAFWRELVRLSVLFLLLLPPIMVLVALILGIRVIFWEK